MHQRMLSMAFLQLLEQNHIRKGFDLDKEIGRKTYEIWLLGDSNPKNWVNDLSYPFDARHPIRHNIITPIFYNIQEVLYLKNKLRMDTNKIYIRNAIENPELKPNLNIKNWGEEITREIFLYKNDIQKYRPKIIFSFGSFSFEFARRCLENTTIEKYGLWNTKELGKQFRARTSNFNINSVNIIPLLHRSISGGRFLQSHKLFCDNENANYFKETSDILSIILLEYKERLKIWCK